METEEINRMTDKEIVLRAITTIELSVQLMEEDEALIARLYKIAKKMKGSK